MNTKTKKLSANNSSGAQSKELLKTLQKILFEESGSVQFVRVDYRLDNVHKENAKEVPVKSIQNLILNKDSMYKMEKGKVSKKTPTELAHMFETIKWDLGAKYWVAS